MNNLSADVCSKYLGGFTNKTTIVNKTGAVDIEKLKTVLDTYVSQLNTNLNSQEKNYQVRNMTTDLLVLIMYSFINDIDPNLVLKLAIDASSKPVLTINDTHTLSMTIGRGWIGKFEHVECKYVIN